MPTGYTADVKDGKVVEFKDFALRCARGMGALIMMRDDPMDAPIPEEFKPSEFYAKSLVDARAKLEALLNMSDDEAKRRCEEDYQEQLHTRARLNERSTVERERYETMLAKVQAWVPPSPEHIKFKEFMMSQLQESINFDCHDYTDTPARKAWATWKAKALEDAAHMLAYYEKSAAEEIERTNGRNLWIKQLRDSLK